MGRHEHLANLGVIQRRKTHSADQQADIERVPVEVLHPHVREPWAIERADVGRDARADGTGEDGGYALGQCLACEGGVGVDGLDEAELKLAVAGVHVGSSVGREVERGKRGVIWPGGSGHRRSEVALKEPKASFVREIRPYDEDQGK